MKRYRHLCLAVTLIVAFAGCDRDQYPGERKAAVDKARLPTPVKQTKPEDALGKATPMTAHTPEVKAEKKEEKVVKVEPTKGPIVQEAPTQKEPPKTEAAPFSPHPGSVAKGTDIREQPSADADILGTFKGVTKVEVVGEEGKFSKVKAPTTGGKSVEGWVLTSSVSEPKVVAKAEPEEPKPAEAKPAGEGKPAAPKAEKPAAPPKAAAAAPAKAAKAGDKGPDNVSLKAIAGMTMKRAAVPFTHKKHYDDYSLKCADCHHPVKAKGGAVPSYSCGDAGCHLESQCNGAAVEKKNKACPNFEDAYHFNCIECHRATSGPTKCAECHSG